MTVNASDEAMLETFRMYLRERQCSADTEQAYLPKARELLQWLRAQDLRPGDIDGPVLVRYLHSRVVPGMSTAVLFSALRGFFCCHQLERMNDARGAWPAEAQAMTRRGPRPAPEQLFESESDYLRFCDQIDVSSQRGVRDRLMTELIYREKLGVTALLRLRRADVDLEKRTVRFHESPQGKVRRCTYQIDEETAEWLERYLESIGEFEPDELLFFSARGPLARQSVWKALRFYAAKAGVVFQRRPQRRVDAEISLEARAAREQILRSIGGRKRTDGEAEEDSPSPESKAVPKSPRTKSARPKRAISAEALIEEVIGKISPKTWLQLSSRRRALEDRQAPSVDRTLGA